MNRTPEQQVAIERHDQNLIVVAGAGSGKTYVLVERYLALLDAHPDWSLNALVAVTFTRKAAQEMRDRVRQQLEKRLLMGDQREIWSARLAAMDSARIDTIHGLCATILRANAAEVGIDPGFEVLDEVDARLLLDDVLDDVLQAIVQEGDPAVQLFAEYETRTVRRALLDLIAVDPGELPADPFEEWQNRWERGAAEAIGALRENPVYRAGADWMPANGWPDAEDKLLDVWSGCWSLLDVIDNGQQLEACIEALQKLKTTIKVNVGGAGVWGGKEGLTHSKDALRRIREEATAALEVIGEPPGPLDQKAAVLLPLWVSLIRRAQTAYWDAKEENSQLDFDDLERLTRYVLEEHSSVRTRYQGTEFKHLLVDEFQDTNEAQWAIVRGLADLQQPGSLFVVGDPKQSIYAFRKADVSVFEQVRDVIIEAGGQGVPLARSFRTHKPLVDGFNYCFQRILVKAATSPVKAYEVELGQPMEAERFDAPSPDAPLEFLLVSGEELGDADDNAETRRRWEAYEIAQRLKEIVETEQRLIFDKRKAEKRPINYGDIAILFQSMTHVNVYEDAFKAAGLPFVTVAGRGYYSRQEVWDLLNLLTALHNPADNLALASALRSPLFSLSDDALLALRLQRDLQGQRLPLWDALPNTDGIPEDEIHRVQFARDCLTSLRALAGRVTISELLRAALDETGYLATLTGLPDGARRRGNVEKLIEKAETSGQTTLGAFSQYLSDLSAREVREGEALADVGNAVTLMTVHASKGLEYPLIVLVDAGWSRRASDGAAVLVDPQLGISCKIYDPAQDKLVNTFAYAQAERLHELRDLAERKRLLYVAATRAQDHLLIAGQMPSKKSDGWKAKSWLGWLWGALDFEGQEFVPGIKLLDSYPWGRVRVTLQSELPSEDKLDNPQSVAHPAWEQPAIRAGQPISGETRTPLLLNHVDIERSASARHLTATQIADLGAATTVDLAQFYRQRFRRSIVHEAPIRIDQIARTTSEDVSRRIIGEMVHRVLGRPHFPDEHENIEAMLDGYAWELGVVHPGQREYAITEARILLLEVTQSDVYRWVESAQQVYRELPFVYRTDKRIIHGILDVMFKRQDDSWGIVDYKTSYVENYDILHNENLIREHAKRYHLQIGVYAAAVQGQLNNIVPDTYIHYIRYGKTVRITAAEWHAALMNLEDYIGDLLTD